MDKGIQKVRKSILKRKKERYGGYKVNDSSARQVIPSFPQDEEKHGVYPNVAESLFAAKDVSRPITGFVLKGILSTMLFFGVALLWQTDASKLTEVKQWTSKALMEEFPFAKVHQWYQTTFGNPLAFSPESKQTNTSQLALPVSGKITETFQSNGKGIKIAPGETTNISALREGIVIFTGKKNTEKTVIIQHADGSKSTYGNLGEIDVHLYEYVGKNQQIGQFTPTENDETVYFSIEKNNEFVDPIQVIKVDDHP